VLQLIYRPQAVVSLLDGLNIYIALSDFIQIIKIQSTIRYLKEAMTEQTLIESEGAWGGLAIIDASGFESMLSLGKVSKLIVPRFCLEIGET